MNLEFGTHLSGLTMPEALLAIVISLFLALACVGLLLVVSGRGQGKQKPQIDSAAGMHVVFVFDEQRLISAPRDWRTYLAQQDGEGSDWAHLRVLLRSRFPDLPETPDLGPDGTLRVLQAQATADGATLRMRQVGQRMRLTLREDQTAGLIDRHLGQVKLNQLDHLNAVVESIAIPVWSLDLRGRVILSNAAYRDLDQQQTGTPELIAPLMKEGDRPLDQPPFTYRVMLDPRGRSGERWYDVTARRAEEGWQCSAEDVTALVRAELAQRNFVQTLTKTFAQLSTGLAIFDRDRQLILFNPALIDLTALTPEFLTARPTLHEFFDNLRNRHIMPEPKSYASWREHLSDLVSAAADGRYQETWSLASGATYRVTGRPHPNGAVAFLFEDISDEILMTRRFRQQLSLSQSVLDAMTDAIVIFDAQGVMSYCNTAYRGLYQITDDTDLSEVTVRDAHRMWSRRAADARGLEQLLKRLQTRRGREKTDVTIALRDLGEVPCAVLPLVGGACMVTFGYLRDRYSTEARAAIPSDITEAAE